MADNWTGLTAFLKDPKLPLDNNPAEQALRQVVLGTFVDFFRVSVLNGMGIGIPKGVGSNTFCIW